MRSEVARHRPKDRIRTRFSLPGPPFTVHWSRTIFAVTLIHLIFERFYAVKHLGAIVIPLACGMALYVWTLPASMREVDALNPALQNQPLMTAHVSLAILSYATFAVSFAAAVLYLIARRRRLTWLPSADLLEGLGQGPARVRRRVNRAGPVLPLHTDRGMLESRS